MPSGCKFVAIALANYADENGECFPSVKRLSKYTNQSDKTVRDHLSKLEEIGFISRERIRRKDGTLSVHKYRFKLQNIQRQLSPAVNLASGENGHSPAVKTTAQEPSKEITINNKKQTKKSGDDRFEEFWEAFEDKRGKQGALKVWMRKKLDKIADQVISGALIYRTTRGPEQRYWKQAQGWLNDGRWEDELAPPQALSVQGNKFGNKTPSTGMMFLEMAKRAEEMGQ
nr:helix-turn-helix domain-containing protein [Lentilitoribacter sp. Alg239-R112]